MTRPGHPANPAPPPRGSGVTLALLGHFALARDSVPIPSSLAAQRLLALLALQGRPVRRAGVAALLWPEADDARAGQNLRSVLHRLPRADAKGLVDSVGSMLSLRGDIRIDVRECADRALDMCDGLPAGDERALVPMLLADLLPDWCDEWLFLERERHRQLRLHALEAMSGALRSAGRFAAALHAALAAVSVEPLRETGHRAVIEVHLAEGNVGEALRQYDLCRRLLDTGLGIRPSRALEALVFPRS